MKRNFFLMLLVMAVAWAAWPAGAAGEAKLSVTPQAVEIGAFYHRSVLTATGEIPAAAQVVLRFIGQSRELQLKRKGRVLGVLWMNLDSVTIDGLPDVYLVYSNTGLEKPAETEATGSPAAELGLEGLSRQVQITPVPEDKDQVFHDLLALKKRAHLFAEREDRISYQNIGGGQRFKADIELPSGLPAGDYKLQAFVIEKGNITAQAERPVQVKMVGLPLMMSTLAFQHGAIFGVMASVVAVLGGLLISLLFKSGAKGGH
jgi:uncharacterized protein (TIGR02186 family)